MRGMQVVPAGSVLDPYGLESDGLVLKRAVLWHCAFGAANEHERALENVGMPIWATC